MADSEGWAPHELSGLGSWRMLGRPVSRTTSRVDLEGSGATKGLVRPVDGIVDKAVVQGLVEVLPEQGLHEGDSAQGHLQVTSRTPVNNTARQLATVVFYLLSVGGQRSKSVTVIIPQGYRGMVVIESPVATCPFPELHGGRWVISVSDTGRGCSRNSPDVDYEDKPMKIAFSNAPDKLLPWAPDVQAKGLIGPDTVYLWGRVSGECEDLHRFTHVFFLGTASAASALERKAPYLCAPTPWP